MDEATRARIAEARAELRAIEQTRRNRRIRRGLAKPRTAAAWEIFGAELLERSQPGSASVGGTNQGHVEGETL